MDRVEQVEIQLGHLCNNRCVFCSSGFITSLKLAGQEDIRSALAQLDEARRRGALRVTFVGGEPTLQRDFPRIVQHARDLGYEEIIVFTNGVRTQQRAYIEELCAGGPLTFRVSIQGGNEATHDRVTGRPGAFQRILDGLALMNDLGQRITVNACLNVLSYASVTGYPEIARRYNVRQVHLDQINPLEIGNRPPGYLDTILAKYSEQAPYLARMLDEFERELGPDFDVNLGNIPFCVMPEWGHRIHHAGEQTMVVSANLGGLAPSGHDKYERKTEHKLKPASCGSCAFDPVCTGVFVEYAAKFGTEELVAVPLERLRRQRNAPRLFTLLEAAGLDRLSRAEPPSGYTLVHAAFRPADPEARFRYSCEGGDEVTLVVRHGKSAGAPIALSGRFAVFVVGAELDERVLGLVRWAFDELVEAGDPVLVEPNLEEARRRWTWGAQSREHLARLCDALPPGRSLDGFRVIATHRSHDGEQATLLLDGPDAARVRLGLATEPPYRSPRVRARLATSACGEDQRRAARHVMQALRASLSARLRA